MEEGLISDAQLEAVVYANMRFQNTLSGRKETSAAFLFLHCLLLELIYICLCFSKRTMMTHYILHAHKLLSVLQVFHMKTS